MQKIYTEKFLYHCIPPQPSSPKSVALAVKRHSSPNMSSVAATAFATRARRSILQWAGALVTYRLGEGKAVPHELVFNRGR